jgi:hypothetical protein
VRHGRVVAVAAMALAGLAGCADRPNDLNTYYDEQPAAGQESPASPSPSPVPPPAPAAPADPLHRDLRAALLSDADVAAEGARPVPDRAEPAGCLPGPDVHRPFASARWEYGSGAALSQRILSDPSRPAGELIRTLRCAGRPLALQPQPGADTQRAWCEGTTCTIALGRGHIVSILQVTAGSPARAAQAAVRLAPVAARNLVTPTEAAVHTR